jgi:hypothetical protein
LKRIFPCYWICCTLLYIAHLNFKCGNVLHTDLDFENYIKNMFFLETLTYKCPLSGWRLLDSLYRNAILFVGHCSSLIQKLETLNGHRYLCTISDHMESFPNYKRSLVYWTGYWNLFAKWLGSRNLDVYLLVLLLRQERN